MAWLRHVPARPRLFPTAHLPSVCAKKEGERLSAEGGISKESAATTTAQTGGRSLPGRSARCCCDTEIQSNVRYEVIGAAVASHSRSRCPLSCCTSPESDDLRERLSNSTSIQRVPKEVWPL